MLLRAWYGMPGTEAGVQLYQTETGYGPTVLRSWRAVVPDIDRLQLSRLLATVDVSEARSGSYAPTRIAIPAAVLTHAYGSPYRHTDRDTKVSTFPRVCATNSTVLTPGYVCTSPA
eukprot:2092335-Rhodomonas_salina.2